MIAVIIKHFRPFEIHKYTAGKEIIYVGFVVEDVELVLALL
jgi:hypothetical protein